jgi:ligand-binding SRPBCC domain-containing protein
MRDCFPGMPRELYFVAQSRIDAPAEEVFRWHAQPNALERLSPPWEPVEILQRAPGIRDDDRGALRVRMGPFKIRWSFVHRDYIEGRQFRDVQISGPFRRWEHTHKMDPLGPSASILTDIICYELPLGRVGNILGGWFVQRKLARLFEYRHRVTADAFRPSSKF